MLVKNYNLTVEGNEIPVTCGRCDGQGYLREYSNVYAGICFDCKGKANFGTVSRAEAEKIVNRRKKAREASAAKREAARLARVSKIEKLAAQWRQDNAELVSALANYQGSNKHLIEYRDSLECDTFYLEGYQNDFAQEELDKEKDLVEVEAGRREITGTLLATKRVESRFGVTYKMMLQCDGYRLFGTIPASLSDIEIGDVVTLTATIEPQEKGFAYFSRPAKAKAAVAA